jgi:hypothetical protein
MLPNIQKYTLPLASIDLSKILSSWTWLIGDQCSVIALTKAGDALLKDAEGHLNFLDIGQGTLTFISNNYLDFEEANLSEDIMDEVLLPLLVNQLEANNLVLKPGQVYSYRLLPILGGEYAETNRYAGNLYEHFSLSGKMPAQIKDAPDGIRFRLELE